MKEVKVKVEATEFAQYVMNDWPWRDSFANNTGSYLVQ